MPDDLARLAYEASLRRLDKQEALLSELRSRTGLLLASASLAASLLGRPAADQDPRLLVVLSLTFGISIGAGLFVLAPRQGLVLARGAISLRGPP